MNIHFACFNCNQRLEVSEGRCGSPVTCPRCKRPTLAPGGQRPRSGPPPGERRPRPAWADKPGCLFVEVKMPERMNLADFLH